MANQDDQPTFESIPGKFVGLSAPLGQTHRQQIASAFGIPSEEFVSTASNTPAPPLTKEVLDEMLRRLYRDFAPRQIALMAMTDDAMIELEREYPHDVTYRPDGKRVFFNGIHVGLRDDLPDGQVLLVPASAVSVMIERPKINLMG